MLCHHQSQCRSDNFILKYLEKGAFEEATPQQVFLPRLPLHYFNLVKQLHLSLKHEGQYFDKQGYEVRDIGFLPKHSYGQNSDKRSYDEEQFPNYLPKFQTTPLQLFGNGYTCHQLHSFAVWKLLKYLWVEVLLSPLSIFYSLQKGLDTIHFLLANRLLLFLTATYLTWVFLQIYIGWMFAIAIRSIVFCQLQDELNHLCCDQELLENRGFLSVL